MIHNQLIFSFVRSIMRKL